MYPISTTIPIPSVTRKGRLCKYPWDQLGIGHSFFVPNASKSFKVTAWRRGAATCKRYVTRVLTENGQRGVRVWLTGLRSVQDINAITTTARVKSRGPIQLTPNRVGPEFPRGMLSALRPLLNKPSATIFLTDPAHIKASSLLSDYGKIQKLVLTTYRTPRGLAVRSYRPSVTPARSISII